MAKIKINTLIKGAIEEVWNKYTNPTHIVHWNFASPDWHCPLAENNLTVGGTYKTRMEAKDGSMGLNFEGIYIDVIPNKAFTYKLADERKVQVLFNPNKTTTELVILFDPDMENPIELQRKGWQAILNHFKEYVENTP